MEAKHNVSLIVTGIVICLFVVFIVLAIFIKPYYGETQDITDPQMKQIAESMAQTAWWATVALVMLPIMLILIVIAGYLFISAAKLTSATGPSPPTNALNPLKNGLLGKKPPAKVNEPSSPGDVLDLRYAKGEITRDQYMAMKADMKTPRL